MIDEEKFEKTVKQMLRAQQPDDATLQRLDAARRNAVQAYVPRRWLRFATAASLALAALVAAFLLIPPTAPPLAAAPDDMELLLAEETIELYEDMEFYQWLSLANDAG